MKVLLSAIALGVLMSVSAVVSAQGGYIGAGIGQSNIKDSPIDMDSTDVGWKLFGGYRLNRFFAMEGSWTDLGEPDDKYLDYKVSIESTNFIVSAIGIVPVHEKFEIFGKIGLNVWKTTTKTEGIEFTTDDGIDPTYGIGAAFNINHALTIRGEWESYNISNIDETSFLSLSVVHNL